MRRLQDAKIESATARAKLPPRQNPFYRALAPDLHLGYRKPQHGPGRWVRRYLIDGQYRVENLRTRDGDLIVADDVAKPDGNRVRSYGQAQALAFEQHGATSDSTEQLPTIADALDAYETDLRKRSGELDNVKRVRRHLPEQLGKTDVAQLKARDFTQWDAALDRAKLQASTKNRTNAALRAALNLAKRNDDRIKTQEVWRNALAPIPNATKSRNIILNRGQVEAVVAAAYRVDADFGLFVETAAVTGARPVQLSRLDVCDLQANKSRLLIPRTKKGRVDKSGEKIARQIPSALAARLKVQAAGRDPHEPLLKMPRPDSNRWISEWNAGGGRWGRSSHARRFAAAVAACAIKLPVNTSLYALRHTSIVRLLEQNVSTKVVGAWHDTSAAMIEKHYSVHISDHTEALQKQTMLDLSHVADEVTDNVVPLKR
jgi:integrase